MSHHKVLTGVLAVALVVVPWLWISARNNFDNVLGRLADDTEESNAAIKEKCNPLTLNDPGMRDECQKAIDDYTKIIKEYKVEVANSDQN